MLHPLIPADELFEGEIKNATLPDGTRVALYNLHGAYFATDDTCTHESASLSEDGAIDGTDVVCGWHLCGFDIATGAATAAPCSDPLRTYRLQLIEGLIHVEL